MPGITMSSSTRSTSLLGRGSSSASSPESRSPRGSPAGLSTASSSRTFCGWSSTTQDRLISSGSSTAPVLAGSRAPGAGSVAHADRLLEVAVEAGAQRAVAVVLHRERGDRDHRHVPACADSAAAAAAPRRRRCPAAAGPSGRGRDARSAASCDTLLTRLAPRRPRSPAYCEHVADQLEVQRVVLDDEDPVRRH